MAGYDITTRSGNLEDAEKNRLAGLTPLRGTETQVAWAEAIRETVCEALTNAEACFEGEAQFTQAARDEVKGGFSLIVDEIKSRDLATWWIDEGRQLGVACVTGATGYVVRRLKDRGLIPTALRESQERRDREQATRLGDA